MSKLKIPVNKNDHFQGPKDAATVLLEYGDFQCPFCAMAHTEIKMLQRRFPDSMRFVFRHFPLTQIHSEAFLAAVAAESAGLQNRFWEMHDMLFENQDILGPAGIRGFAEQLELDMDRFEEGLMDEALAAKVKEDFMGGARSGVNGTPSFYIGDTKYEGPLDSNAFEQLIRAA